MSSHSPPLPVAAMAACLTCLTIYIHVHEQALADSRHTVLQQAYQAYRAHKECPSTLERHCGALDSTGCNLPKHWSNPRSPKSEQRTSRPMHWPLTV